MVPRGVISVEGSGALGLGDVRFLKEFWTGLWFKGPFPDLSVFRFQEESSLDF